MHIKRYKENISIYKIRVRIIGGVDMNNTTERYCTVTESLEQSLKEMQLMRQGKLPKKTWKEYRVEKSKQREKEGGNLN